MRYGFNLSPNFVLHLGGTYDLGKTEIYKETFVGPNPANNYSCKADESNHYSLYLAPGYRATPKSLVYGKVAYHSMRARLDCTNNQPDFEFSRSRFNGWGLGMGVNTMLSDNVFLYAEAQHVMYREKTFPVEDGFNKIKPASTIGSIGIGINF